MGELIFKYSIKKLGFTKRKMFFIALSSTPLSQNLENLCLNILTKKELVSGLF